MKILAFAFTFWCITMSVSAQHVGIGTTNPQYLLDVHQQEEEGLTVARFKTNHLFSDILFESEHASLRLGVYDNLGSIGTTNPSDFLIMANNVSGFRMKHSTQYVGLGQSNPEHRLHVSENQSNRTTARFNTIGGYSDILVDNATQKLLLGVNVAGAYVGTQSMDDLQFLTGGAARMTIRQSNGHVGIGTTLPESRIHVNSGQNQTIARFRSNFSIGDIILGSSSGDMTLSVTPISASIQAISPQDLILAMNNFEAFIIKNNTHYVGINHSTPDHRLHVLESSSALARFQSTSNTSKLMVDTGSKQTLLGTDLTGGYVGTNSPDNFYLMTHQTRRLTVQHTTGNVGIATETPQATLDVDGSLRTRYSGTQVITPFNSTGVQTVTITIPEVPAGWNFLNTVVLASNADGNAVFTINQTKLTSLTTLDLVCNVTTTGLARINWVIFKL